MERGERDSTADWQVPAAAAPPRIDQLEARIDEAVSIARASEQAVRTVGAAAVEAAGEARRAAELAERASSAALAASAGTVLLDPVVEDPWLREFTARADRVMGRLRAVERQLTPTQG